MIRLSNASLKRSEAKAVFATGLVLQEVLQGHIKASSSQAIVEAFSAIPLIEPERSDYVAAADLRARCRQKGVQIGTVDALLIQLCLRFDLTMLSTDRDFDHAAQHLPLKFWRP